jgi:hypothetical protein
MKRTIPSVLILQDLGGQEKPNKKVPIKFIPAAVPGCFVSKVAINRGDKIRMAKAYFSRVYLTVFSSAGITFIA